MSACFKNRAVRAIGSIAPTPQRGDLHREWVTDGQAPVDNLAIL